MSVRSQIDALLQARAATPRRERGPKYLYFPAGTVVHPNTDSKIKGKSDVHQVFHRSLNPARQGKKWK